MRIFAFVVGIAFAMYSGAAGAADAPTKLPDIPPLNSDNEKPFVVDGVCKSDATHGFAFHFATDGKRQLCVLYDAQDGTPLYLSDGQQTLLYELCGSRIVRVPTSRGFVKVIWHDRPEHPLEFSFGLDCQTDASKLPETKSCFQVDCFVAASRALLKPVDSTKDTRLFAAERAGGGGIEAVQIPEGQLEWFRFASREPGKSYYTINLTAHLGDVPERAIRFPDLTALRRDVTVLDLDQQLMPNFFLFVKSGSASLPKMALAGGPDFEKKKSPFSLTWDELRKLDEKFGQTYRAALSKQDLEYRMRPGDEPSTQPSHARPPAATP